jgi:neutral ceramidase
MIIHETTAGQARIRLPKAGLLGTGQFRIGLLIGWMVLAVASDRTVAGDLRCGVGVIDITPPVGYRMAGSYHEQLSEGVHDPLMAKVLVLEQDDCRIVIATVDLCSIGREASDPLRAAIANAASVPVDHTMIWASHTHGGPEYYGSLRDLQHQARLDRDGKDDAEPIDYLKQLEERLATATSDAVDSLKQVAVHATTAIVPDLAHNRRFLCQDGTVRFNPPRRDPSLVKPAGPVDDRATFVEFTPGDANAATTILWTFPMHTAIHGGPLFSADYPGVVQESIGHDGPRRCVTLFGEGTAGDINHIDFLSDRSPPDPQQAGQRIADAILAARSNAPSIPARRLRTISRRFPLPLRHTTPDAQAWARDLFASRIVPEPAFLRLVDAYRELNTQRLRDREKGDMLQAEVQGVAIDDQLAIVALPHEVFVQLGMMIRQQSPFATTLVVSLSNDLDFYVPTARGYVEGSYEVTTSSLQPGSGELLVSAALQVLQQLHDQ